MKRRLFAEEVFRKSVRDELTNSDKRKDTGKLMGFLNSPFALFLFSSVVLAGLGKLYTDVQASIGRQKALRGELIELITEIDYRTTQSEFLSRDIEGTANITDGNSCVYLWRIIVGDREYQPSIPKFKETHWLGLVSKVKTLAAFGSRPVEAAIVNLEMETDGGRCGGELHLSDHLGKLRSYTTKLQALISEME